MSAVILELTPVLRVPLATLLVLFLPGYAIVSILFPSNDGPDAPARIGLSVALSLAAIPPIALAIDRSPWAISQLPVTLSLTGVTIIAAVAALIMRMRLPIVERYAPNPLAQPVRLPLAGAERWLLVALIVLAVGLLGYGGFDAVQSRFGRTATTELAIFNAEGQPGFYPREIVPGEFATVMIQVTNHENESMTYTLIVGGDGVAPGGPIVLEIGDGQTWTGTVDFTVGGTGERQEVRFDLYLKVQDSGEAPYRSVSLVVDGVDSA